ncbi:hypothetical protein FBEOM_12281 [Fusarium beomiforme]|uniref:Uncharacterized protein n=1 Tax=Fusarium beomiforme TaxID=44412 RepID=A0A9P5A815_9HYPO|nr:hypothetical protein FBEOM_12281 [Fusarium beomiforme]
MASIPNSKLRSPDQTGQVDFRTLMGFIETREFVFAAHPQLCCTSYLHWLDWPPVVFYRGAWLSEWNCQMVGRADADASQASGEAGSIEYESVPDRWLIFRHIEESQPEAPALEIFLVESNKIRNISSVLDAGSHLESASSPFIDPSLPAKRQLETVLGQVSRLSQDWGGIENDAEHYHSPLTVLGSGNPLFADYMPHNSAVFSFHDDLTWEGIEPGAVEKAKINYAIYGFFAKDAIDLSSGSTSQPSTPVLVCWGTLYSVQYERDAAPSKVKASEKAREFVDRQPLAVGDDVLDSCIAILKGSTDPEESSMADVFQSLKSEAALQQSNSQLDRNSTATTNFKGTHGGYQWRVKKEDTDPAFGSLSYSQAQQTPATTAEQNRVLRQLNTMQSYLDALYRRKRYTRHLVFCEWWKHRGLFRVEDLQSARRRDQCVIKAKRLLDEMQHIASIIASAEGHIMAILETSKSYGPFEKEEDRKFFSHTDPAFVLKDMGYGWPENWEAKPTAVDTEAFDSWLTTNASALKKWIETTPFAKDAAPTTKARIPDFWERIAGHNELSRLPTELRESLTNVMLAFTREVIEDHAFENVLIKNPSWKECCWDGQPWLPLFIDWEVEYVHIPSNMWQLRYDDNGSVQYGLSIDQRLSDLALGSRTFSGRTILQPNGQRLIQGLLDMMHPTVPGAPGEDKIKAWAEKFLKRQNLTFGRLDGFTDHLLTLCQGAHAVPTQHDLSASEEKIFADAESLQTFYGGPKDLSSGGLDVTPYGSSHEGLSYETLRSADAVDAKDRFFQPVTHGQARLTQFKIVDRFGQVICAHDPRPEQPKKALYPHIGSAMLCESGSDSSPNLAFSPTVDGDAKHDCEWFQLGPRINQDARLHAHFLYHRDDSESHSSYQPVAEGETAVFAWLLINFHNQSIQVYDRERMFKGEAILPSGPDQPVHWNSLIGNDSSSDILPHMMPGEHDLRLQARLDKVDTDALQVSKQPMSLEDLIASMSHAPFLIGLWKTIATAQDHIQPPPAQQIAQFPSALVGRPVAVAHLGLGIELATPPMQSQAYADYSEHDEDSSAEVYLSEASGNEELTRYEFGIKLGDMLGHQDGLIGYFNPPDDGKAWNLVTYYVTDGNSSQFVKHTESTPSLTVSPSYPRLLPTATSKSPNVVEKAASYETRRAEDLQSSLVTVLMDPFLPIHVRSGILPAAQAQLNQDGIERDLQNLGVWFSSGPVIIGARGSDPVSSEDGKMRIQVIDDDKDPKGALVPVHTMPTTTSGATWQWVQPVMEELQDEEVDTLSAEVRYVHLGVTKPLREGFDATVGADNEKAKEDEMEVAVALDGYLLLRPSEKKDA